MPLPPPQVLASERLVERWLYGSLVLAGCTAAGTRVCPDSSHLRGTSVRNLQAFTLISHLGYAH